MSFIDSSDAKRLSVAAWRRKAAMSGVSVNVSEVERPQVQWIITKET